MCDFDNGELVRLFCGHCGLTLADMTLLRMTGPQEYSLLPPRGPLVRSSWLRHGLCSR